MRPGGRVRVESVLPVPPVRDDREWGPCERCGHKASEHRSDEPSDRCMVSGCECCDYDPPMPPPCPHCGEPNGVHKFYCRRNLAL